ncbi:hypothetical protein [Allocoleopsis sp.]|uniref:hypothetical protein n=1 Tax=Allocoleopsis sp. TaxID=3088169 RepID=UPI002FD03D94
MPKHQNQPISTLSINDLDSLLVELTDAESAQVTGGLGASTSAQVTGGLEASTQQVGLVNVNASSNNVAVPLQANLDNIDVL